MVRGEKDEEGPKRNSYKYVENYYDKGKRIKEEKEQQRRHVRYYKFYITAALHLLIT